MYHIDRDLLKIQIAFTGDNVILNGQAETKVGRK